MSNDFLPFAVGGSANVTPQATYAADTTLLQGGFASGIAKSPDLNKVWRQSSIMAAVVAQFIVAQTGANATDDGTTATLLANLTAAVQTATPGRFLGVQTFTSSGTYTPGVYTVGGRSVTATKARFRWVGGGGGGGGVSAPNSAQVAVANGGNGGSYMEAIVTSGLTAQAITIGAAGAGGAAGFNFGGAGGNTVVGTIGTAQGGNGGSSGGAGAPPQINTGQANNGGGPVGSGITVNKGGTLGQFGIALSLIVVLGGQGGDSPFGAGGKGGSASPGSNQYGAGGGGANQVASGAATAGAAGIQGYCIIEEFA
jgi:hypothetical protein